jgi:hypothetical protein
MLIDAWLRIHLPKVEKQNTKKIWESDEEDELRNLFINNATIDEICRLLNRNHWDILSKLKSLGLLNK